MSYEELYPIFEKYQKDADLIIDNILKIMFYTREEYEQNGLVAGDELTSHLMRYMMERMSIAGEMILN